MADVNLAVVYYSTYGTNYAMAQEAVEAARAAGAEVRLRKVRETAPQEAIDGQDAWKETLEKTSDIQEAEPDDLAWADAFLFSTPTRYGGAASQMRAFIDTLGPLWQKGELADKCVTAMTSAMNPHGGQETTLQTLYYTFMHWGAIIVPPGYTRESFGEAGGNPYGTSITTGGDGLTDEKRAAIRDQSSRLVEFAKKLVD
jgi:NAD(P)H dehydrogenase (quinone)